MEIVSGVGDGVFWVGLLALLAERDVGAGGFALAAVVRLAPRALISVPAGALADRIDRRRLLVGLDLVRAITMLALAVMAALDAPTTGLLATVLLSYALAAPYRPALTAALPFIAGERRLSTANALIGTVRQVMTFVGPLCGALLIVWIPVEVTFVVDAVTFGIAAVLVGSISELAATSPARQRSRRVHDRRRARSAWHEARRTHGVVVIAMFVFVMYLVRGAELVLYVLAAGELLGLGPSGIGLLTGAVGFGAVAALPAMARLADSPRTDLLIGGSLVATAVSLAVVGSSDRIGPSIVALSAIGAALVAFEVVSVVLLQRAARTEVLGSVFGIVGAASNAGKLLGAVAAPALAAWIGVSGAFVALAVVVAAFSLGATPGLARIRRATATRRAELAPVVERLAALAVFDGATRPALERVAAEIETEAVATGTVVIRQGDPADDLFVVVDGRFSVFDGERSINTMQRGDWFGEIGLLQRRARTASVVADTAASLWRIPGAAFLAALGEMSAAPSGMIDVMAERLARAGDDGPR